MKKKFTLKEGVLPLSCFPTLGAELCSGNSFRVKRTYISMPVPTFWFCEFE